MSNEINELILLCDNSRFTFSNLELVDIFTGYLKNDHFSAIFWADLEEDFLVSIDGVDGTCPNSSEAITFFVDEFCIYIHPQGWDVGLKDGELCAVPDISDCFNFEELP
jgi:hypothetical protein